MNTKSIKNILIIAVLFALMAIPVKAYAADYDFSYEAYVCPGYASEESIGEDPETAITECAVAYIDDELAENQLTSDNAIAPGTIFMLVLKYEHTSSLQGYTFAIKTIYSPDKVTALSIDEGGITSYRKKKNPAFGANHTKFNDGSFLDNGQKLTMTLAGKTAGGTLSDEGPVMFAFFKVNDDASGGTATFQVDTAARNGSSIAQESTSASKLAISQTPLVLNIAGGTLSQDTSLSTFTATGSNGQNYSSQLSFTPGTTNRDYSIIVPNDVTSITLNATTSHEQAQIIGMDSTPAQGSDTKTYSLNVGNNVLQNFSVQAQDLAASPSIYRVTVYRLNNDATLSNLSLGSNITFTGFNRNTKSYDVNVPYAIKQANVTGTVYDTGKATIKSGNTAWLLTNAGTTKNEIKVVVNAEDCDTRYSAIAGNTCHTETYTVNVYRELPSTDNNLTAIKINSTAVQGFTPSNKNYTFTPQSYATSSVKVEYTLSDSKATIKSIKAVNGSKTNTANSNGIVNLEVGDNDIQIEVEAEDLSKTTYHVVVRRKSNNAYLSTVSFNPSDGDLVPKPFVYDGYDYTYTVSSTTSTVTMSVTAQEPDTIQSIVGADTPITGLDTQDQVDRNVVVTAEDGNTKIYAFHFIRQKDTDNKLATLTVTPGTWIETFNPNTNLYHVNVDGYTDSVNIAATVGADSKATIVSGTGKKQLLFGDNNFSVVVRSEANVDNTYNIVVNKAKRTDNSLKALTFDTGNTAPETNTPLNGFNSTTITYNIPTKVENDVQYAYITAEVNDTGYATYEVVGATNGRVSLKNGLNEIKIIVTAHNNSTKTYTINVTRKYNSNVNITSVNVLGETATCSGTTCEVTVDNQYDTVGTNDVIVTPEFSGATITNKPTTMSLNTIKVVEQTGTENIYPFTVVAEDGTTTRNYTIKINRRNSTNTTLSRVNVKNQKNVTKYCTLDSTSCQIEVPVDTTSFTIEGIIPNTAAISFSENGGEPTTSYNLPTSEKNKVITALVTAEDGNTETYTITVVRTLSSNNNLSDLTIDGITIENFDPDTQNYTYTIPASQSGTKTSINVKAIVEDTGKATIETDLTNDFDLEYGNNTIKIVVVAENGQKKTYTITANRNKKEDTSLQSLKINSEEKVSELSNDILEINVPYTTTSINILAIPTDNVSSLESENAIITAGNGTHNLSTGLNTIKVTVAAQNRTVTKDYTIKVTRALNTDTGVQSIQVAGVTATGSGTNYEVTVPNNVTEANQSNVVVTVNDGAVSTDAKATYVVTTTQLSTKSTNVVTVKVVPESGEDDAQIYTINVTRTKSAKTGLNIVRLLTDKNVSKSCNVESNKCTIEVPTNTERVTLSANTSDLEDSESSISFNIGSIDGPTFEMPADQSVLVVNARVTAENETDTEDYTITINRQLSSDNSLSDLKVDGTTIADFDPDTLNYTYTIEPNESGTRNNVTISATVNDIGKATIETDLSNPFNLNYGNNTIKIIVVAENGQKKTYTITVNRKSKEDTSLQSLVVGGNEKVSDIENDTVEINVPYSTTGISINATPTDNVSSLEIENAIITAGNGNHNLSTGRNEIKVTVAAQNRTVTKNYTIIVNRALNTDAGIQSIKVAGVTATGMGTDYSVTVPNSVTEANQTNVVVTVNDGAVSTDAKATYVVTTTQLSTKQENLVKFKVIPESGEADAVEYTIRVIRTKSDNTGLNILRLTTDKGIVKSCNIESRRCTIEVPTNTLGFTMFVNDGDLADSESTISYKIGTIEGPTFDMPAEQSNLTVTATVLAENETNKAEYTITINRTLSSDNSLSDLKVDGTTLTDFDPDTLNYTYTINPSESGTRNSVTISATVNDVGKATITQTLPKVYDLEYGNGNEIKIEVVAENGQKKTYTITVDRKAKTDTSLQSLKISNVERISELASDDTLTINIPYETTYVTLNAIPTDNVSSITSENATIVSGIGRHDVTTGTSRISLVVAAQDRSVTRTYTIIVNRDSSMNTDLKKDTNGEIVEDAVKVKLSDNSTLNATRRDDHNFEVTVPNDFTEANQNNVLVQVADTPASYDTPSTYTVNNTQIYTLDSEGNPIDNIVQFTVISEGGATEVYNLHITRTTSNVKNLTRVNIYADNSANATNFCLFEGTATTCKLTAGVSTTSYRLEGILEDSTSSVKFTKDGTEYKDTFDMPSSESIQTIKAIVTAENGTEKEYTLTIERTKSSNAALKSLKTNANKVLDEFATIDGYSDNKTSYEIDLIPNLYTQDTVTIQVEAFDDKSIIKTSGMTETPTNRLTYTYNITYGGTTTIEFTVEAEDGTEVPYSIKVNRPKNIEPRLSGITIDGTPIENFDSDPNKSVDDTTYEYTIPELAYNHPRVNIQATNTDPLGRVEGTGTKEIQTLKYNGSTNYDNVITLKSYADDESVYRNYIIHFTRTPNNDTGIQKIEMSYDGSTHEAVYLPNESRPGNRVYAITVPNSVKVANSSNVIVTPNAGQLSTDNLAYVSMEETVLKTSDPVTDNVNTHLITVTAEDGTTQTYTLLITATKSNIASIEDLLVVDPTEKTTIGSFNPTFKPETTSYIVNVPVTTTEFEITGTPSNNGNISGLGRYDLTESQKSVELIVYSEDGTNSKKYTLSIVREQNNNNNLNSITVKDINGNEYEVVRSTTENNKMTVTIPGSVDKVILEATPESSLASVIYVDPDTDTESTYTVPVGSTTKEFKISSESQATQSYYITIVRQPKTVATLSNLTYNFSDGVVHVLDLSDPNVRDFTLDQVENDVKNITITATPTDSDATVTGTGNKLIAAGDNTYRIIVTAEDGVTELEYTISINRKLDGDATLKVLYSTTNAFNETFVSSDPNHINYTMTVDSSKETIKPEEIVVETTSSTSTYVKDPELTLSSTSPNIYNIEVTAQNGTKLTYTITITRPQSDNADLSSVTITGGTLSPSFRSDNTSYTITVPYGASQFAINSVASDSKATISESGNTTHNKNEESFNIVVTSESGVTKTYVFTIAEAPSQDGKLLELAVDKYELSPEFTNTIYDYTIGDIENTVESIKIIASASNANSEIKYYHDGTEITECRDLNECTITLTELLNTEKSIMVRVTPPAGQVYKSDYIITYKKVRSNNAYLSSISSSTGTMSPVFSKGTFSYTITVPYETDNIDLTFTTENPTSSMKINSSTETYSSPKTITVSDLPAGGTKVVQVQVIAEDGKGTRLYNISIKRSVYVGSTDNYLQQLSVVDYNFTNAEFDPHQNEYELGKIPYTLSSLTVLAIPQDSHSTLEYYLDGIKQESNVIELSNISQTISVKVTPEDPNSPSNVYYIHYTKEASSNNNLSSLLTSPKSLEPTFNKNTTKYTVNVPSDTNSLDFTAIAEDTSSTITINGENYISGRLYSVNGLISGTNIVNIVVRAENGITKTYTVSINKESDSEIITSNEFGHEISNGYIMTVGDEQTVTNVKNQLDNENSKLEIWSADDTQQLSDNEIVGTGMIVKLRVNGNLLDSKIIIIKGDTSGDGIVDIFDSSDILNHFVARSTLSGPAAIAADINDDDVIDIFDSSDVLNHYVGRSKIEAHKKVS